MRKQWIMAFLVIALLVLAGCGAKNEKSDTIKVGLITPLSGDLAKIGVPIKQAAELAVEEINNNGGVDGKLILFYAEDGMCSGKEAANAYRKLKDINQIDVVIATCSPELLSVSPLAKEDGVLVLSPSATSPDVTNAGDHVYRVVPSDALQGKVGSDLVTSKGHNKVGVIYTNQDYGVALKDVFVSNFGEDKIIGTEAFAPNSKDFRTQLTKLKDADAIYTVAFGHELRFIIDQMKELNMNVPIYAAEAGKTDDILANGEGVLLTVPSAEGSTYNTFASSYTAKFGESPKIYSGESYDVIKVIAKAAQANDNLLEGMKTVTSYNGVAGSITFDENGDVLKPYDIFTVEDGAFKKVETIG